VFCVIKAAQHLKMKLNKSTVAVQGSATPLICGPVASSEGCTIQAISDVDGAFVNKRVLTQRSHSYVEKHKSLKGFHKHANGRSWQSDGVCLNSPWTF